MLKLKPWTLLCNVSRRHSTNFKWKEPSGANTNINIYNSITRSESPLILLNENVVKWYTCGPTVYDETHMGHISCYVRFDIIRRIMEKFFNLNVVMVMGVTDIDDKIINKALKSNVSFKQITKKYEEEFHHNMKSFHVKPPSIVTRVTEYIPQIINFILNMNRNFSYVTPTGSVYFDTEQFGSYGRFVDQRDSWEENEIMETNKKSPRDFALWKAAKKDEPFWESPWGKGRPGWHIECSTMASQIFGENLDIHSGGIDLMFPHHENEECQSVAFHKNNQWANYWIHAGHLNLANDTKMSKSLGNTLSAKEFLKEHSANDFRMLCLMKPYRNNIELSPETMKAPKMSIHKINNFLDDCDSYIKGYLTGGNIDEELFFSRLKEAKTNVIESFKANFNTPKAIEIVFEKMADLQKILQDSTPTTTARSIPLVASYASYVKEIFQDLGINIRDETNETYTETQLSTVLDYLVKFRSSVRECALNSMSINDKENSKLLLQRCDEIRNDLMRSGIQIKDRGKGQSSWIYGKE